jgi:uncharacterized iron-regulated membrane protein
MSRLTRAIRFVRHWHARAGVLAALFLLLLALTGLALNHTDGLSLAQRKVDSGWLMRWYGLQSAAPKQGYLFESGYFVGDGERWVMDGHVLHAPSGVAVGVIEINRMRYVATDASLYLYQPDGRLIDKLSGPALPAQPIRRIGQHGTFIVLETARGIFASADALTWESSSTADIIWAQPHALPDQAAHEAAPYFAPSLPLERVLVDVHSGRILGRYGPYLMDLAALLLIALALSGLWMYVRTLRKRH